MVQGFGHLGHHDPPDQEMYVVYCGVLLWSTLYQEQHAPEKFTFSSDAQKMLIFSDSGYLEGLPIERRYSYICPCGPKYVIMYRQVCWRVAWENDRKCIRSSPKNTEMYRNHRFFRGALMCSLPGASSCRTAIPWQKRIPYLKRISSPEAEAMLEVQGVSLRWKQSTLTSMRVSCWSDVQGGSLPSVVLLCFCSPTYHLQFRKGFCCHIAIISNYLYLLFAK